MYTHKPRSMLELGNSWNWGLEAVMHTGVAVVVIGSIPTYYHPATPVPGHRLHNSSLHKLLNDSEIYSYYK